MNENERLLMEYKFPSSEGRTYNYLRVSYLEHSDEIRVSAFYQGREADKKIGKMYLYGYDLADGNQSFWENRENKYMEIVSRRESRWSRPALGHSKCRFRLEVKWEGSRDKASDLVLSFDCVLRDSIYLKRVECLTHEYYSLKKQISEMKKFERYRDLFFALEGKLREVIGTVHYAPYHCPERISEEKLRKRLIFTMGGTLFSIVHHSGFDMKTGQPYRELSGETDEAVVASSVSLGTLYSEVELLRSEAERIRSLNVYLSFWFELYSLLKSYALKDDGDEEDELIEDKDLDTIKKDIMAVSKLFESFGFMLRYYEDVLESNPDEADTFMLGGRFGVPALYKQGDVPVLISEGRRDMHSENA